MLNGHIDIDPLASGWTRDPFDPWIADGKLFGHGVYNMKAGVAACIMAALAIQRSGVPDPRRRGPGLRGGRAQRRHRHAPCHRARRAHRHGGGGRALWRLYHPHQAHGHHGRGRPHPRPRHPHQQEGAGRRRHREHDAGHRRALRDALHAHARSRPARAAPDEHRLDHRRARAGSQPARRLYRERFLHRVRERALQREPERRHRGRPTSGGRWRRWPPATPSSGSRSSSRPAWSAGSGGWRRPRWTSRRPSRWCRWCAGTSSGWRAGRRSISACDCPRAMRATTPPTCGPPASRAVSMARAADIRTITTCTRISRISPSVPGCSRSPRSKRLRMTYVDPSTGRTYPLSGGALARRGRPLSQSRPRARPRPPGHRHRAPLGVALREGAAGRGRGRGVAGRGLDAADRRASGAGRRSTTSSSS